jgi:hypothetical protein
MDDEELGRGKTCFIVSPIGDPLAPLGSPGRANYEQSTIMWSKVFEPATAHFGLTIVRSDRISEPGEIPTQIFQYLRDAEVVIADVSGANPNVMYELGLRHSRPNITLQVGEYERLPFDVGTIRTIQFVRDEAGFIAVRDQLIESLRAALIAGNTDLRATSVFSQQTATATREEDVLRSSAPESDVEADEPGIVEVLAEAEAAVNHVTEVLNSGIEQMTEINRITTAASEELSSPQTQSRGFAGRLQVSRQLAAQLAMPSNALESTANLMIVDIASIDGLVRYVIERVTSGEEDTPETRGFLEKIIQLVDGADQAAPGITGMRDGARGLRRLSSSLGDVSRTIERAMDRYLEALRTIQSWRGPIEAIGR